MKTMWRAGARAACAPGRRHVMGTIDPSSLAGGRSLAEDIRTQIDLHRNPNHDANNMGKVLGGEDIGMGTDCAHLEGPQAEAREHRKIGSAIDTLFPANAAPLPNAMEIALAPTADELQQDEMSSALREAVRDRYRNKVAAQNAEKRRIEQATAHLQAAVEGRTPPATPAPPKPTTTPKPPKTEKLIIDSFADDPYDGVESMGESVASFMKRMEKKPDAPPAASAAATAAEAKKAAANKTKATQDLARQAVKAVQVERVKLELAKVDVLQSELAELCASLGAKAREAIEVRVEQEAAAERPQPKVAPPANPSPPATPGKKMSLREKLAANAATHTAAPTRDETQHLAMKLRMVELEVQNMALQIELKKEQLLSLSEGRAVRRRGN